MTRATLAATVALGLCSAHAWSAGLDQATEEFRRITRELGLRADSPVRTRSTSGPKPAWHGRVFENLRNDMFDAVPHEARQLGASKSMLRRNQFGFNVAGPVVIPRVYDGNRSTFFSLSYEGVRENVERSVLRTVPTAGERMGDFSATVDSAGAPLLFYDPASTRANSGYDPSRAVSLDNLEYLRDPFPGNRIPESRMDTVARKALGYYPAANANAGPYDQNNFYIHSPESNIADGMIGKLDHSIRDRHRLSIGLQSSTGSLGSARWFPNGANPGPSDREFQNRHGSLDYVLTASARTINTVSFEASMNVASTGGTDAANYPAALGLKGSPGNVFPIVDFGSYLRMGQWTPNWRNVRNTYTLSDTFSTRVGKHALRAILQYTATQVNTYGPSSPSGYFNFSSGLTSLPGIVNTGHAFASFLLGQADYANMAVVGSPSYFRNGSALIGLRDNYEIAKGLSFSVGLNIQPSMPRQERYNRQSTVDLSAVNPASNTPGALILAGAGGTGRAFKPTVVTFGPSAGVSWNPRGDTKTVLRASFWRSYSAMPIYFGQWGTQGFNGTPTFVSPNAQLEPAVVLANGLPSVVLPAPGPAAANNMEGDLADRSSLLPLYQGASVQLEREMPGAMVLTLGASYAGGRNLFVGNNSANPDALPLTALAYRDALNDEAFNQSLRPYPQYKGFDLSGLWPSGRYQRDSGFLRLEKRASQGLTLSFNYEFAKQLDDYSGRIQNFFDSKSEWSMTPGLSPQAVSLSYVYELPIGSGRRLMAFDDWRHHLVDGWSLSGMSTLYSGDPIQLRPLFNNTGGVISALHVNAVGGVDASVANPTPEQWFNAAAFEQPVDFTLGNVARTHPNLRNPGSQNLDLSLAKRFALSADRAIELSAVGLNFLNHANWNDPDPVIGSASSPNTNAGKIIGSTGGRIIQLGLRFTF